MESSTTVSLNTRGASAMLGIAVGTLENWRCRGVGPRFFKLGKCVRYSRLELERFLADSERGSTGSQSAA